MNADLNADIRLISKMATFITFSKVTITIITVTVTVLGFTDNFLSDDGN